MKRNYLLLFIICFFVLLQTTNAQDQKVTGVISDANNQPLAGASVKQKGTSNGTTTSNEGNFTLTLTNNKSTVLEITAVGYLSKDIDTKKNKHIVLSMTEDVQGLNEVVLIGYQKVTRKKATAAISSISGKEIENLPSSSFDQLLQGRLSGVNVQNFSGDPGARAAVSVRGSTLVSTSYDQNNVVSSPLYVVDGVPQSNEEYSSPDAGTGMNYLGGVNPNDIESIDVLKDASAAAIYMAPGLQTE